jgi:hypothetical protein
MFTSRIVFVVAAVAFACVAGLSAYAVDTNWIHDPLTPGSWHDPDNWDNGLPYYVWGEQDVYNTAYVDNGGTAQITADCMQGPAYVGYDASGHVEQQGGSAEFYGGLYLGSNEGSYGTYDLWAGDSVPYEEHVGVNGTGVFNHFGGNNYPLRLYVGEHGTYNLYNGSSVPDGGGYGVVEEFVDGRFNQSGGTNELAFALSVNGNGVYNMSGGGLSSVILFLGGGEFNQSGASNVASSELYLQGTYNLAGGSLTTCMINLGYPGAPGTFNVTSNTAYIAVSEVTWGYGLGLTIADGSVWSAVPGTTVHVTGAPFENQSTNEADLAGMLNTTFVFEGGGVVDTFEIAGLDMGKTLDGFDNNFALCGLTDIGDVQLVDSNDNGNRGGAGGEAEALYVKRLILNAGSTLDLNNYHLYTLYFENNGGTVLNGQVNVIPEPATMLLPAIALFGLGGFIVRRKRGIMLTLGALALLGGLSASAYAVDTHWINGIGSWHDPANWDNGLPYYVWETQEYNTAYVDNGGTAQITADCMQGPTYVGYDMSGYVEQQGGAICTTYNLYMGYNPGSFGKYTLRDGYLFGDVVVGYNGIGQFDQYGGGNEVNVTVGENGTYNQYGGNNDMGVTVYGRYNQYGGANGHYNFNVFAGGIYELSGGDLAAFILCINAGGVVEQHAASTASSTDLLMFGGQYNFNGGALWVSGEEVIGGTLTHNEGQNSAPALYISCANHDNYFPNGVYNLAGGSLAVGTFDIGSTGTFNVTNSSTSITIGGDLTIRDGAAWSAVPGTTVHMTGSFFDNQSTSEADLAGILNTTFIFEGGVVDTFEIASLDMGKTMDGFDGNFALYGLTLGGADIGYVQLVDSNDNGNRGGAGGEAEALYVKRLILNAGSTLDLNNYHLYTLYFENNGGTVLNGQVNVIPEPATAMLLIPALAGLAGVVLRTRKG